MQKETEREMRALQKILSAEDIAEKKARIYSRLLTDAALSKDMESLAERHDKRKKDLQTLICGKVKKDEKSQNEQGRCGVNEE